jgi:hypothetical protein
MSVEAVHAIQKLVRLIRQNLNVRGGPREERWMHQDQGRPRPWPLVRFKRLLKDLSDEEFPDQVLLSEDPMLAPVAAQIRIANRLLKNLGPEADHVRLLFADLLDSPAYCWGKIAPVSPQEPPEGVICPAFYPVDPNLLAELKNAAETMHLEPQALRTAKSRRKPPGRKMEYSQEALAFAYQLERDNENISYGAIRKQCRTKFPTADLPQPADFPRWMNRHRAKQAN